jgi:hypothetical protein
MNIKLKMGESGNQPKSPVRDGQATKLQFLSSKQFQMPKVLNYQNKSLIGNMRLFRRMAGSSTSVESIRQIGVFFAKRSQSGFA